MTADLEAIRARLAAATPGPWTESVDDVEQETVYSEDPYPDQIAASVWSDDDRALIAHAPEDLLALTDELAELRAREAEVLSRPHRPTSLDDVPVYSTSMHMGFKDWVRRVLSGEDTQ